MATTKRLPTSCEGIISDCKNVDCLLRSRAEFMVQLFSSVDFAAVHVNVKNWVGNLEGIAFNHLQLWDASVLQKTEWVDGCLFLVQGTIVGSDDAITDELQRRLDSLSTEVDFDKLDPEAAQTEHDDKPTAEATETASTAGDQKTDGTVAAKLVLRNQRSGILLHKFMVHDGGLQH